jgi:hypothetical protein
MASGNDVERILGILNQIKDEVSKQITELSCLSDYRIETISHTHNVNVESSDGAHSHGSGAHKHNFWLQGNKPTGGNGWVNHVSDQLTYPDEYPHDRNPTKKRIQASIIYEREDIEMTMEFVAEIFKLSGLLNGDVNSMREIERNMYTDIKTFNNSYGSPWKEIYILKEKISNLEKYAEDHLILQWIGEKFALMNLMQIVLSYTIDAKLAITHNQDYIQRGYDHEFNDQKSSISWGDMEKGATIGNRDQNTPGSVNVQRESDDPY